MDLTLAEGPADLLVRRWRDGATIEARFRSARLAYRGARRDASGRPDLEISEREGEYLLRFGGTAAFAVGDCEIHWYLLEGGEKPETEGEIALLGLTLAVWLERRGTICLHGAAVARGSGAIGILGSNRSGKSSLAASLLSMAETELVSDDVLAVDLRGEGPGWWVHPSYPQMRLWPHAAEEFLGVPAAELDPVHPEHDKRRVPIGADRFGRFGSASRPVTAFFLPLRRDDSSEITLERLSSRDAAIEFIRHSFLAVLPEALGWQARRFETLVALASQVPTFRFSYPNGWEHLPRVRERLLDEVLKLENRGVATP
jgi:hypothetical protein